MASKAKKDRFYDVWEDTLRRYNEIPAELRDPRMTGGYEEKEENSVMDIPGLRQFCHNGIIDLRKIVVPGYVALIKYLDIKGPQDRAKFERDMVRSFKPLERENVILALDLCGITDTVDNWEMDRTIRFCLRERLIEEKHDRPSCYVLTELARKYLKDKDSYINCDEFPYPMRTLEKIFKRL